ncbi:hypothetical protein R4B61_07605 (plasmid) [Fructilactobacillus vespulae]|uniref:hypothetical protein n=1 Tax=Fructilactobacillus vespulae TaxID=1249630 RepID=UPI0039B6DF27
MNEELLKVVRKLDDFDCAEHHWYEEIGTYNETKKRWETDSSDTKIDESDLNRIKAERKLYLKLIKLRKIDLTSNGSEDKEKIYLMAMKLEKNDFTIREICRELGIKKNFLRENRKEYRKFKERFVKGI